MSNSTAARAIVLALWAGFFGYLWASNDMVRYLGPRTYWVIPFGFVTLGAAAAAHLVALRELRRDRRAGTGGEIARTAMSRSDVIGIAALLVPIVASLALPQAELGALAVSRKSTGAGAAAGLIAPPAPEPGRDPNFIDIHFANESEEYATSLGIGEGTEISLVGFVSERGAAADELTLTRFYVSCCAADAIPYSVAVVGDEAAGFENNTWLRVDGTLVSDGTEYRLAADDIEEVPEPESPYLY